MKAFATMEFPLHASGLRNLLMCPWREVLTITAPPGSDDSGPAADTGSAMHAAARALHTGSSVADSIKSMQSELHKFPKADLVDAANMFLVYASHGETQSAEVVLCEEPIRFDIKAHPSDPTQAPIVVIGTLDQIRRRNGRLELWDIKTTKKDVITALRDSMHQAAAYCIGASFALGEQVHPGGLIMPRRPQLYIPFSWKFDDIAEMLAPIAARIAEIRRGEIHHVPSSHMCEWCPGSGPELCVPRKKRFKLSMAT